MSKTLKKAIRFGVAVTAPAVVIVAALFGSDDDGDPPPEPPPPISCSFEAWVRDVTNGRPGVPLDVPVSYSLEAGSSSVSRQPADKLLVGTYDKTHLACGTVTVWIDWIPPGYRISEGSSNVLTIDGWGAGEYPQRRVRFLLEQVPVDDTPSISIGDDAELIADPGDAIAMPGGHDEIIEPAESDDEHDQHRQPEPESEESEERFPETGLPLPRFDDVDPSPESQDPVREPDFERDGIPEPDFERDDIPEPDFEHDDIPEPDFERDGIPEPDFERDGIPVPGVDPVSAPEEPEPAEAEAEDSGSIPSVGLPLPEFDDEPTGPASESTSPVTVETPVDEAPAMGTGSVEDEHQDGAVQIGTGGGAPVGESETGIGEPIPPTIVTPPTEGPREEPMGEPTELDPDEERPDLERTRAESNDGVG